MLAFIRTTCGTQFAPAEPLCFACLNRTDERQHVPAIWQNWKMLDARFEGGLVGYRSAAQFAIGSPAADADAARNVP